MNRQAAAGDIFGSSRALLLASSAPWRFLIWTRMPPDLRSERRRRGLVGHEQRVLRGRERLLLDARVLLARAEQRDDVAHALREQRPVGRADVALCLRIERVVLFTQLD